LPTIEQPGFRERSLPRISIVIILEITYIRLENGQIIVLNKELQPIKFCFPREHVYNYYVCKLTNSSTTEVKFQYFTIIVIMRHLVFAQMAQFPQTIDQRIFFGKIVFELDYNMT